MKDLFEKFQSKRKKESTMKRIREKEETLSQIEVGDVLHSRQGVVYSYIQVTNKKGQVFLLGT